MVYYAGMYGNSVLLQHHGILGMKWGKHNGPPYPLDAPDHSASEKKAGWRKSLSKSSNDSSKSSGAKNEDPSKERKKLTSKENYCYDRSLGHYWALRRAPSNAEWVEIDRRKKNGERLADILSELRLLK